MPVQLNSAIDKAAAQKATAQVTLQFAVTPTAPQTPDQPTGLQGIAYSGGVIPGYGNLGDCIIDLADIQIAPTIFLLVNHDVDQRAGKCNLSVVDHQLLVAGQFSRASPIGQQIAAEFAEGAPFQFSVGIQSDLDFSPDKRLCSVNSRDVMVNSIFTRSRVLEVSLVPAGADPHTSAMAFSAVTDLDFLPCEATMTTPPVDVSESDRPVADTKLLVEVDRLTAENQALAEQVTALQQQMTAARTKDVDALFSELGQTPPPVERQAFIEMTVEAFSAVATMLREAHKPAALAAHLFGAQTAGEGAFTPGKGKIPSPAEVFEQRRKAAAKARAGQ